VSLEEFEGDAIVQALLAPDVQLFDEHGRWSPSPANAAPDSISLGFGFHLARCGDGGCCPQGN
ncbi:MAG TPA: hypothetical protein VE987_00635, partial [Polyangiaceae bacterium]|nr:hypothetical protein [Polyangiaceae bacterium]